MSTRIGRLVLDGRPATYQHATGEIELTGWIYADGLAEVEYLRREFVALAEAADEPVMPVLIEDGWSGMARVTSASTAHVGGSMLGGMVTYEITVAPVARPEVVSALSSSVRGNDHVLLFGSPSHAVPAGYDMWSWLPTGTAVEATRTTGGQAAGNVAYRRVTNGAGQSTARWICPPERWYAGGCHVEEHHGARWLPVVGRRTLRNPWRIGNGLVRVTLVEGGSSAGRLRVEWYRTNSDQWTPAQEWGVGSGGGFAFTAWNSVEVVENAPHRVLLRARGQYTHGYTTLWITLRRGSRLVDGSVDTANLPGHRVITLPALAAGGVTAAPAAGAGEGNLGWHAYLSADVADSGGLRWVFTGSDNFGYGTGTGLFLPENNLAGQWSWGINAYFTSAAGDSGDRVQTAREWFTPRHETVRVGVT